MDIRAVFSCNPDVEYSCVVGSIFSDEFNETLDSGSILIPHVPDGDALADIKPYDFVCVFDYARASSRMYYLVDNFVESVENTALGIKQYTISLMSITKMLEKIQLPNRSVRHTLNADGTETYKTIYQVINETMLLYCPKVKTDIGNGAWDYRYLFDWQTADLQTKFNVNCKDFSLSQPTLRTMLTVLMTQIGCLPKMMNRTLGYIDMRTEPSYFGISDRDKTNQERSMSSDSYINTLVNMGQKILDTNNYVYSENIGFRDRDNVFLKQKENLFLNTALPIYKVRKLMMNTYMYGKLAFYNMSDPINDRTVPFLGRVDWTIPAEHNSVTALLTVGTTASLAVLPYTLSNIKIVLMKSNSAGGYDYRETISISGTYVFDVDVNTLTISTPTTSTDWDNASIRLTMTSAQNKKSDNYFASWIGPSLADSTVFKDIYYNFTYDISKLCVESGKRQELDTDYLNMQTVSNIDQLSQYIYATVSYGIGDTKIEGFSQTYSVSQGWWNKDITYIENIFLQCQSFANAEHRPFGYNVDTDYFLNFYGGLPTQYISKFDNLSTGFLIWDTAPTIYSPSGSTSFANMFFSIAYQPMNTLTLKYTKNIDFPIKIEQLDTSESAITALDDLGENESQKINRLGNDVVSISQTTADFASIQPLNSIIDGHIVFKRTISVGLNAYNVIYYASKDYVIKNYFTSIQTKYRAYQYASYEEAIVRKEQDTVFLEIGRTYFNGDDILSFGANAAYTPAEFVAGMVPNDYKPIEYLYEEDVSNSFKGDLSIVTYKNNMLFSYQDFDNVSPGIYIQNKTYNELLGGLPQSYYIFSSSFMESHTVGFIGKADYISSYDVFTNSVDADTAINNVYINPSLTGIFDRSTSVLPQIYINGRIFYKDVYEQINGTLQVEVNSKADSFIFSSWLLRLSPLISSYYSVNSLGIVYNSFSAEDEDIPAPADIQPIGSHISVSVNSDGLATIKVTWPSDASVVSMKAVANISGKYYEIAAFQRVLPIYDMYYCSFNDTKTHKVYRLSQQYGILYPDEEIQVNTLQRLIK